MQLLALLRLSEPLAVPPAISLRHGKHISFTSGPSRRYCPLTTSRRLGLLLGMCAATTAFALQVSMGKTPASRPASDQSISIGSTHLVYVLEDVKIPPGAATAPDVVKALNDRVDPTGRAGLVWHHVGPSRVEVVVPEATEIAGRAAADCKRRMARLFARDITEDDIWTARSALKATGNSDAFMSLARGVAGRKELLERLASAVIKLEKVAAEEPRGSTPGNRSEKAKAAIGEVKVASDAVFETNLGRPEVFRVARMKPEARVASVKGDPKSPLAMVLDAYPGRSDEIRVLLAVIDELKEVEFGITTDELRRALAKRGAIGFHVIVAADDLDAPERNELLDNKGQIRTINPKNTKYMWARCDSVSIPPMTAVEGEHLGRKCVLIYNGPGLALERGEATQWRVKAARTIRGGWGKLAISLEFDEAGGREFAKVTGNNVGKSLGVVVDGQIVSVGRILTKIEAKFEFPVSLNAEESRELAEILVGGPLPGSLKLVSEEKMK